MKTLVLVLLLLFLGSPRSLRAEEDPRYEELSRKIDVLTEEVENLRLGAVAETTAYERHRGLAPAASKVYGVRRGVSIGGYGEMLLEAFDDERQDDVPAGKLNQIDLLRQILYVGYKFNDELVFNSEVEFEHAGTGGSTLEGEVAIEFAYIDWSRDPRIGVRAGLLLMPLGIVNELHEPPVTLGARRPDVESLIIPTTWRANGAGVFGEFENGVEYRAYITEGLDARGFTAASPVRGGRQKGSKAAMVQPAFSGRLDFAGVEGLRIGISGYRGDTWQDLQPDTLTLEPVLTLFDVHGMFDARGLTARALYAHGTLSNAGPLSDALNLSGSARLGDRFFGWYAEAAYDVWPLAFPETRHSLEPYFRYERIVTQDRVPGSVADPALDMRSYTIGAAFKPHPNVVLKGDRQVRRNEARTAVSQWNVQVGYLF